jgi:hypothetical protein
MKNRLPHLLREWSRSPCRCAMAELETAHVLPSPLDGAHVLPYLAIRRTDLGPLATAWGLVPEPKS